MTSLKGLLEPSPSGARLTKPQAGMICAVVAEALRTRSTESPDVRDLAQRVIMEAVAAWPTDRSCVTCGFESEGHHCERWDKSVPDHIVDVGCDEWEEHGVPF